MRGIGVIRPSSATLVAVVALGAGVAGGALAAGNASPTITACVHKHGGGLYRAKHCARHDRKLSWNELGPQGPPGNVGQQGPQGPPGTVDTSNFYTKAQSDARYIQVGAQTEFAYGQIREDASIRSSSPNVTSASGTPGFVEHPGTGEYCVDFSNSPSSPNEIEGSVVGHAGSTSNPVFIYVANGQATFNCNQADALQILIMSSTGVNTDARFSFLVP